MQTFFYNKTDGNCFSGNFLCPITDHLPNFLILEKLNISRNVKKNTYRDFKNFDTEKFTNDFDKCNIGETIANLEGVNDKYNSLHDTLESLFDKHAPLKTTSNKKLKQLQKPWITNGILKSIKKKNLLYGKFMKTKENEVYKMYKYYRDKINHLIRKSKFDYFSNYF